MKKAIFHVLMFLAVSGLMDARAAFKIADEPGSQPSAPGGTETVIVPFDGKKPLAGQKPGQVYVPYERFIELWEAAKTNKRGIPPEKIAEHYVLGSSHYDATLEKDVLRVKGVIDLQTFGEGWVSVPLVFKQVKIGIMLLDGRPAPIASEKMAVEKAGPHRIEVEFEIPVKGNTTRIAWGIPKTAGTLVSLTLRDKQMKASVQPGNGVVERTDGDRKIVTAALGGAERVEITLDSSVGLATMTQAALAKITATLDVTPAVEFLHSEYELSFPESRQDHFTVLLDKGLALVKLNVPDLKSWKLSVENERQVLDITLTEPARGSFKFSVDAERSVAEAQRHFPFLSVAANRIEQTDAIFSTLDLHVAPQPSATLRQVSFPADGQAGLRLVAAFSGVTDNETVAYDVQAARPANKAEISYVYQVNHSKIEMVAALKLRQDGPSLFDIEIGLPADFVVQAVESGRLKDWWRDGDTLHARFHGATPEMTPLVLHLVKQYKTIPDELAIKALTLPDAWDAEGNGIIAASKSVKAGITLTNAKEMNPQDAATDFRILPPMERKRGFSFKGRDFSASVKLETLPARLTAEWVMSAQAHESSVSVSIHAGLTARQGSATGVSFRLPATAPEARVTGENVREATSGVEGDWRVYRVAFQQDLIDRTEFTVDLDLPGGEKTHLPAFEILNIDRAEGFVIVDNASEYEMQVMPSGLDIAQSSQIPYLPEISRNARLFRVLPGWSLQIGLTRLEKEAGRSAFVAWAELTTAIRADGSEWHRATYHLQNRSLQFLPVKLPGGADLASVSVAGENVRADRGKVDGKDVLLIPLIKTKPGDMSYDVDLVYRKQVSRGLWAVNRDTLADPEVVGITVERTLWNLYVPEELDARHFSGNMEEVLAEVNRTEKLEGMLDELKTLNGLVSLGNGSSVSRNAGENFERLAKTLEDDSAKTEDRGQALDDANATKGVFQKQGAYVEQKKREIQQELSRQRQQYESNVGKEKQQLGVQKNAGREVARRVQIQQTPASLATAQAQLAQAEQPVQQASQSAATAQSWAVNGGFATSDKEAMDKAKEVDRKDVAGKKLYINDYVMNVQSADAPNQSENAYYSRGVPQAGAAPLTVTGGTLVAGASSTMVSAGATTVPVTTGQGAQANAAMIIDQSTLAKSDVQMAQVQDAMQQLQPSGGVAFGQAMAAPVMKPMNQAQRIEAQNGDVKILNNARANNARLTARQGAGEEVSVAATAPATPSAPTAMPAEMKQAAGQDLALAEANKDTDDFRGTGIGGTSAGGGNTKQPAKAQLQQGGAISLQVDFPTEGHVYHFKKLKANAELTLWISRPASLERWKWLFAFLLIAAMMKGFFKWADRTGRNAAGTGGI